MGRQRQFDEHHVLCGAMEAFRRDGYAAVSIKTLEKATGLTVGSLYHSYGDKEGLFLAALTHYNEVVLDGRIERHAPVTAGIEGLRTLFLTLLNEPGKGKLGCLITNSAIEQGGSRTPPQAITSGLHTLLELFEHRLKAVPQDSDSLAEPPNVAALRLLALYQGILVLVRANWDAAALTHMIDDTFNHLTRKTS